jgi:outer membrane protein assembly factor BamB
MAFPSPLRACRPVLALLLVASPAAAQSSTPVEFRTRWSPEAVMFRGDPSHRGVYPVGGVPRLGGLAWRTATEGTVRSSPAVTRNRVFVGSSDGHLYALDRATGAVRWKYPAGGSVLSSPAVADGLVLFTRRDGTLVALDAERGSVRWQIRTGAELPFPWGREGWDFYVSSPVIVGNLAIFAAGDGNIYALDAATGRERWRYAAGTLFRSSPAVGDGYVVVGGADGYVYALGLDGKIRWRGETEGATLSSEKEGFDRKTIQGSPAIADGKVYVGSRDAYLYAFDLRTGKRLWRVGKPAPWVVTSPVVWNGRIYYGSSDGQYVEAVDADSGKRVWFVRTPDNVIASPVLADSILYVADMSGNLFALDAATGAERWRTALGSRVFSTPVPAEGALYVGCDDGAVYALHAGAGASVRRAVFYDSTAAELAGTRGGDLVRDYLNRFGYATLDAKELAAFFEERIRDRAPSVVVFALDVLPEPVAGQASDTALFRRYLDAGGKVVWTGEPPALFTRARNDSTGKVRPVSVDPRRPTALLGVPHDNLGFTYYQSVPTKLGERWGLRGRSLSFWTLDPKLAGAGVLALDEFGQAGAWVKSFGGPPGTGFVFLWGQPILPEQLPQLRAVADYGIWIAAR